MDIKLAYKIVILIMITMLTVSCDGDESIEPNCATHLYFVSSAVCSESSIAAALRDEAGEIYIARNFFYFMNKEDVTVDLPVFVDFELTGQSVDRSQCGLLVVGTEIILSCVSSD